MLTLNSIAKSYLLDRGYPMHWYLSALKQACEGTKELAMHTISIIKTATLQVDKYGYANYPCDYFSFVRLGGGHNGQVRNFVYSAGGGNRQPIEDGNYSLPVGWFNGWQSFYGSNFNEFGENTWGITGYVANSYNGFEEIAERRQFKVHGCYSGGTIVLDYIPLLGKCNNATSVPDAAEFAIKDWIHWKLPRYERGSSLGGNAENERVYKESLRKLRAFNNKLTPERLAEIREQASYRGYK